VCFYPPPDVVIEVWRCCRHPVPQIGPASEREGSSGVSSLVLAYLGDDPWLVAFPVGHEVTSLVCRSVRRARAMACVSGSARLRLYLSLQGQKVD